jgi:hypothetical protein
LENYVELNKYRKKEKECEKIHTEGFHNFCPSSNIIRVIKSMGKRLLGHSEHMRTMIHTYIFFEKPDKKKLLG